MPERSLLRDARLLAVLAAAVCVLPFVDALGFPFLEWDDRVNVTDNPFLRLDWAGLGLMLTGTRLGHWHPLTWLSLADDKALWGTRPMGFHATNLLLHGLNAGLLFLAGRRLLAADGRPESLDAAAFPALAAALLWAVHPMRAESVAWVTERRDVLSGTLSLGCLLAHLASADARAPKLARRFALLALVLGALAMACKVFAVMLPAALLVVDLRLGRGLRWKEKLPYAVPAAVSLCMAATAQAQTAAVGLARFGVVQRLAQAGYGLSFHVLRTAVPSGLSPFHERSLLLEPGLFLSAGLASAAGAAAVWALRRRQPGLAQAALAYLVVLLPTLGLFKSGRMTVAERWSYGPAMPLCLLAAGAMSRLPGRVFAPAALAWVLGMAALTQQYVRVWSSDRALWTRAVKASPLSYFARSLLADALEREGRLAEAAAERRRARDLRREVFERAAAVRAGRGDPRAAPEMRRRAEAGLDPGR